MFSILHHEPRAKRFRFRVIYHYGFSVPGIGVFGGLRYYTNCEKQLKEEHYYQCDLALFKVSSAVVIDQDETQIISGRELFVDVFESWGQIEPSEEEPDRDGFASDWCTVHNFKLGDRFRFIVLIRSNTSSFSTNDGQLHMFNL